MSSIPFSKAPLTWSNISLVAASNLGTTVPVIAVASAPGNALTISLDESPPLPPLVLAISAATAGASALSSRLTMLETIFSICTGKSRVMAAETAVSSCFCRSRSADSRSACSAVTNPERSCPICWRSMDSDCSR